jgi:hypothetical protein
MSKWINALLWIIYIALLAVLLPHTAWAFAIFEPDGAGVVAWAAAFAFEAAIAALTYKLIQHIEAAPRSRSAWRRFRIGYLNVYAGGLLVAVAVSALANWAHAVEFGTTTAVVVRFPFLAGILPVAFGAILPGVSFIFAHVLADVAGTEADADPELIKAKDTSRELRAALREAERAKDAAEQQATEAERRFDAAGDLFARLFADEKKTRILAVAERWPQLPTASIAMITESSPSHVSETLAADNGNGKG